MKYLHIKATSRKKYYIFLLNLPYKSSNFVKTSHSSLKWNGRKWNKVAWNQNFLFLLVNSRRKRPGGRGVSGDQFCGMEMGLLNLPWLLSLHLPSWGNWEIALLASPALLPSSKRLNLLCCAVLTHWLMFPQEQYVQYHFLIVFKKEEFPRPQMQHFQNRRLNWEEKSSSRVEYRIHLPSFCLHLHLGRSWQ